MATMHYVGMDVHKKTIAYCVKTKGGSLRGEGTIDATRAGINEWMETLHKPWSCAMEATLFTGWLYDHIKPHAREVKVAHPLMLRAIAAAKKKNDRIDAEKIADLLRVDLLPECYMVSEETRRLRRVLRFRTMIVHQATRFVAAPGSLLITLRVNEEAALPSP